MKIAFPETAGVRILLAGLAECLLAAARLSISKAMPTMCPTSVATAAASRCRTDDSIKLHCADLIHHQLKPSTRFLVVARHHARHAPCATAAAALTIVSGAAGLQSDTLIGGKAGFNGSSINSPA